MSFSPPFQSGSPTGPGQWAMMKTDAGNASVQVRTTHLTSAQILDLHNTPVELVPTPGAGKSIVVLALVGAYHDGGTPYSSMEGVFLIAGPPTNPGANTWMPPSYFPLSTNMTSPGDATILASGGVNSLSVQDLSLVAQSNAALTDGNGTLDVTVVYVVVG